jgi:predicted ABC-type transport system involved in lysophospholipase L1 biosynthesis ATPase subunit
MVEQEIATAVVEARVVTREFRQAGRAVPALRGVDLRVAPGELVALRGRSGAGKTTLLNILVGLDEPTSGTVLLIGQPLRHLGEWQRARLRREVVGILFQNAHLFPLLTAQENVEVMLRLGRSKADERRACARQALERVGLGARAHHRGLELSGGEQQRVALARALAHRPRFLAADEPTGNLDTRTAREIATLLREMAQEQGTGVLVATHDPVVVKAAARVIQIEDGLLTDS